MATLLTNQGLSDALRNQYGIHNDPSDALGVSDFGALAAGTTSIAAATNKHVNVYNGTPTESAQQASTVTTFGSTEGNFTITTITEHNDGVDTYTGVQGGADSLSLTKTTDFTMTITFNRTAASG